MKTVALLVCLFAFCNLMLLAQRKEGLRSEQVGEKSAMKATPQEDPAGLKTIYTNLGKSKTELYDGFGFVVSGPNSAYGYSEFEALPFTPKSNAHVTQVQVAVLYAGSGANQVNLSIYSDSSGIPGTLLAGPVTVTNLPAHGTCCGLALAAFSPVPVAAGTQYWVVADTPLTGPGSDFTGNWAQSAKPIIPFAAAHSSGWYAANGNELPAGEVQGTVP